MATQKELNRDIRYIDRDFSNFRNELINYSKVYFPNTYNDFTDTSTGMLFMEMASYVGDVLSFYLDNQIQETFIQYARQTENLFNISYALGYRPNVTTVASVDIEFYQQIPSKISASVTVPDYDYALTIPANTTITTNDGTNQSFLIEDVCDFSHSSSLDPTEETVYQISGLQPTFYLLKKTRKAISAEIKQTTFTFTTPVKFDTRIINDSNIIQILDVFDTNLNEWYEVNNLAQENVFDTIRNTNINDPNFGNDDEVPYLLQLKQVQRRFASRFLNTGSFQLQFGAGSVNANTEEIVPNPDNVGLGLPFEKNKLTTAFSPLNFVFTNTYGIAPANTTLTVRYLTGGGLGSNVEANTLTVVDDTNITFNNPNLADTALANTIFNSLASSNTLAADGGQDGDTVFPQILMTNSHDGKNAFNFEAGLYRLVCSNGLVIADTRFESVKMRHMGYSFDDLQVKIKEMVENLPLTVESMNKMKATELEQNQILEFAKEALNTRFKKDELNRIKINMDEFIKPVRKEDEGNDLWSVFNVVQEKIIEGDFDYMAGGKLRKAREIKNFKQDMKINKELFNVALEYAS